MIAYKFLRSGAVGPYSGFRWPSPEDERAGDWVDVEGPLRLAANAIHACRVDQLPYWLDVELWELELQRPVQDEGKVLLSRRGRLLRPIDGWTADTAVDLARACTERGRLHATSALRMCGADEQAAALDTSDQPEHLMATAIACADDVPEPLAAVLLDTADTAFAFSTGMSPCLVAYLAARVARRAAAATNGSALDADREERDWQARWLAEGLELTTT